MFDWLKKWKPEAPASRQGSEEEPSSAVVGWAVARMPEEELVRHLKQPKDVRVLVSSAESVGDDAKYSK